MTRNSTDPIDQAIDEVENSSLLRKVIFGAAIFALASCLVGMFFLVTRLIVPSGYF
ncbi:MULTISPECIES: hypothetical protein [Thalassospira]|jgi:hypothetical protein|uniref:Uncharacterized protein n=1 Tax=Thalassospira aquimaris TaxID=3037796 RepID=A0ABT6GC01_9PROT|nr:MULTISPECIES: hypothetical protein [Thalassospira]MDG4719617.1 hypothetical protein [Thalassospira sp. FZY0004]